MLTVGGAVTREVIKDDHYKDYLIPKGAQIMANNWAISRDTSEYPDPETFRPERFLDDAGKALRTDILHPMKYAFGFGHRTCPGRWLADALLFSHFAHILAVFDVALPPSAARKEREADGEMKVKSNGAACRIEEVYVRLATRSPAAAALLKPTTATENGHGEHANGEHANGEHANGVQANGVH